MSVIAQRITPVILSGGAGTRLWPLSRKTLPKQLLSLISERSMLQETVLRVADRALFNPPVIIASTNHRFIIAEQLRELSVNDATIVLEPVSRNTTAAAAIAALIESTSNKNGLILLMPSDHVVQHSDKLMHAINNGMQAAQAGNFVLFGIKPECPATGYGYIQGNACDTNATGTLNVKRFVEKPDIETARSYVASGDYLWNSGMFLLPVHAFINELRRLEPKVLNACRQALEDARRDLDFIRLDEPAFAQSPAIAIDYAVMEKTDLSVVVPTDCGWADIGSWSSLWDIGQKDQNNNVILGNVIAVGSKSNYLRGEGPLIAALGVEDLVIVSTPDAVLVTRKSCDQDIKELTEQLREKDSRFLG